MNNISDSFAIAIIDCSNIAYMAYHTMTDLSVDEVKTEISFGFLNQILSIANRISINRIAFCFDSKKSYRKNIYPNYKKTRRKDDLTEEEKEKRFIFYKQIDNLRKQILPELGFTNVFHKNGYEADDLIAHIVRSEIEWSKIIVSTDQDLYQLLYRTKFNKFSIIHNPRTKKNITPETFTTEYRIPPSKWAKVKAIAGCSSDNVAGVSGVGEVTAIKYLKNELNKKSKKYKDIINSNDMINSNMKLVKLPFVKETNPIKIKLQVDNLKKRNFINIFDKYDFQSFLKKDRLKRWEDTFNLK